MPFRRSSLAVLVVIAACTSAPPEQPASPRPAPQPVAPAPPTPASYIDRLLARADDAIDQLKLTTPRGDNAYAYYQQVLEIDPQNTAARAGLERIVERYVDLAVEAQDAGQFDRAAAYLDRAESVIPAHPGIAHARRRGESLARSVVRTLPLDVGALGERRRTLQNRLFHLGVNAKNARQRVIIIARNDAEGRWIYQQMNAAPGPRLRGELRLGTTPSVTLQRLAR